MRSPRFRLFLAAAAGLLLTAAGARASDLLDSLKKSTPDLKSAGALCFGPEGVLFVADPMGGAVFAIDTDDRTAGKGEGDRPKVEGLDDKIASLIGIDAKSLLINDAVVNPISGNVYLSAARGKGPDAPAVLLRVTRASKVEEFPLKDVKCVKATLPNLNDKNRKEAITHLEFVKNRLYIAGLSNEEFASNLRSIAVPFAEADKGASVEIFHGSHGGLETKSPVRTFVAYDVGGEANLLAAYTCTPLVKIPVKDLKVGEKIAGKTIAELGNGNRPLDMIVYSKGGKDYLLLANSARGVMKIPLDGVDKAEAITKPVKDKPTAGIAYETIESLKGVEQLDAYDKDHAMIVYRAKKDGPLTLETVELP
jgi:hypothetical protein